MEYMSPLLKARTNASISYKKEEDFHEKLYEELQRTANRVKPNEAKAKLIKEGPVTSAISLVKDTFQDGKNFIKAVKTGHLGDNNLGRTNDLGMKAGAVLLAAFLASQAKTKTSALMQFIGGGTFFATMALWPKIFINLPARIVHGFNIGQRYVSAQGDKKDFFLDNQFLPWDAYSRDEMAQIGRRTGIDINSENGLEKIQRKMQKTALQNRTLWMATAGFATPLITAVVGNFVTPKVENAVVKHGLKKTQKILKNNDVEQHIKNASPIFRSQKGIEALFKTYEGAELDNNFFETLANMLQVSAPEYQIKDGKLIPNASGGFKSVARSIFKNPDDIRPVEKVINGSQVEEIKRSLKELLASQSTEIDLGVLKTQLEQATSSNLLLSPDVPLFSKEQVREMIAKIGEKPTTDKIKEVIISVLDDVDDLDIEDVIKKSTIISKEGREKFFETIKEYNSTTLASTRGRIKAYLDIINPVIGDKSESVYTKEYTSVWENLLKKLNLRYSSRNKDEITLSTIHKNNESVFGALIKYFEKTIKEMPDSEDEYKKLLKSLYTKESFEGRAMAVEGITRIDLNNILAEEKAQTRKLTETIIGTVEDKKGIFGAISRFIAEQKANLDFTRISPVVAANFERRLKNGDLADLANDAKLLDDARRFVYSGNLSFRMNDGHFLGNELVGKIFNHEQFTLEKQVFGDKRIKDIVEGIKGLNGETFAVKNRLCVDIKARFKEFVTRIYNNKSWARIFIPLTALLVAVTLIVQPLFGKINDEYPDLQRGGAK